MGPSMGPSCGPALPSCAAIYASVSGSSTVCITALTAATGDQTPHSTTDSPRVGNLAVQCRYVTVAVLMGGLEPNDAVPQHLQCAEARCGYAKSRDRSGLPQFLATVVRKLSAHTVKAYRQDFDTNAT